jgi:hypothetical protein
MRDEFDADLEKGIEASLKRTKSFDHDLQATLDIIKEIYPSMGDGTLEALVESRACSSVEHILNYVEGNFRSLFLALFCSMNRDWR